jgi:hypothetical protein
MRCFLAFMTLLFLSSCTVSDSQMSPTSTTTDIKLNGQIKEITFLNNHKINSKLTVELIKKGIKVKPFSYQQSVKEKTPTKDIEYNLAASRYGLKIESEFKQICILSSNQNNDFTFTLIDIRTNEIVNIYQKRGPNGDCPPLTPIYITYANYLSNLK